MNYTRRNAIKTIVAFGALAPTHLHSKTKKLSPNSKLNIASVGVGGKGWDDMRAVSDHGKRHNIVAICDMLKLNSSLNSLSYVLHSLNSSPKCQHPLTT